MHRYRATAVALTAIYSTSVTAQPSAPLRGYATFEEGMAQIQYQDDSPKNMTFLCLRKSLLACKTIMQTNYKIDSSAFDEAIASWNKIDISGNKISGVNRVSVTLRRNDSENIIIFDSFRFNLDGNGSVNNISISPDYNPAIASTLEEYNKTRMFDQISMFLPLQCEQANRLSFYQFFNDRVKPTIDGPKRDGYIGVGSATDEYQYRSQRIPLCGAYIDYRRDRGISTIYMDSDNPSGRFDNVEIIMWSSPSP